MFYISIESIWLGTVIAISLSFQLNLKKINPELWRIVSFHEINQSTIILTPSSVMEEFTGVMAIVRDYSELHSFDESGHQIQAC